MTEQEDVSAALLAGKLVSVREAAALTGLTADTIRKWIRRGLVATWGPVRRARKVNLDDLLKRRADGYVRRGPKPKPGPRDEFSYDEYRDMRRLRA